MNRIKIAKELLKVAEIIYSGITKFTEIKKLPIKEYLNKSKNKNDEAQNNFYNLLSFAEEEGKEKTYDRIERAFRTLIDYQKRKTREALGEYNKIKDKYPKKELIKEIEELDAKNLNIDSLKKKYKNNFKVFPFIDPLYNSYRKWMNLYLKKEGEYEDFVEAYKKLLEDRNFIRERFVDSVNRDEYRKIFQAHE